MDEQYPFEASVMQAMTQFEDHQPHRDSNSIVTPNFNNIPLALRNSLQEGSIHRGPAGQSEDSSSTSQSSKPSSPGPCITQPAALLGEQYHTAFQFVVNGDKKQARQTVRKHVMSEYRRRERWEHASKGKSSDAKVIKDDNGGPKRRLSAPSTNQAASQEEGVRVFSITDRQGTAITNTASRPNKARFLSEQGETADDGLCTYCNSRNCPAGEACMDGLLSRLQQEVDLKSAICNEQVDPFSRLQFDSGRGTQELLHHFAWVMPSFMDSVVTGTNFSRIGWLYTTIAVHDPTPNHTVLGYTLAHLAGLRGIKEPPLALEHKANALKAINERMERPEEATSDATIGAVINLISHELVALPPNPQRFSVHMAGLTRLIRSRGGIEMLRDNPGLQTAVLRLDLIRAYIVGSSPRYPGYLICRSLDPIAVIIPSGLSVNGLSPSTSFLSVDYRSDWPFLFEDCLKLIRGAEDLVVLIASAAGSTRKRLGYQAEDLLASAVQQLLQKDSPHKIVESTRLVCRNCRLAILLLMDAIICDFNDRSAQGRHTRELGKMFIDRDNPWRRILAMIVPMMQKTDRIALEEPWRAWYFADLLLLVVTAKHETWLLVEEEFMVYIRRAVLGREVDPQLEAMWDFTALSENFLREWT